MFFFENINLLADLIVYNIFIKYISQIKNKKRDYLDLIKEAHL